MEHKELVTTYIKHHDASTLTPADQRLLQESIAACQHAYAPYSLFKVGVAIHSVQDNIITGSNQENGAFPIGQCAERVALYRMTHELGRVEIDTIAIAVDNPQQKTPASPCGSCRQLLNEYRSFQDTPIRLLLTLATGGEIIEIKDVTDLLPLAFDGKFLGY